MSNHLSRKLRRKLRRSKGDTAKLTAQLAPLEEQTTRAQTVAGDGNNRHSVAHQEVGAIVVEGSASRIGNELSEVRESAKGPLLDPLVLVIVFLALTFIAFIAWEVSKMPAAPQ